MALRLLVVEDDDHIRTALRWALEDEGYDVAEAVSGEEALAAVAVAAPDLMVVDLMLGAMDGFDVIREVRRTTPCRSSWSAPAPTPTTSWPRSRPAPTTT